MIFSWHRFNWLFFCDRHHGFLLVNCLRGTPAKVAGNDWESDRYCLNQAADVLLPKNPGSQAEILNVELARFLTMVRPIEVITYLPICNFRWGRCSKGGRSMYSSAGLAPESKSKSIACPLALSRAATFSMSRRRNSTNSPRS